MPEDTPNTTDDDSEIPEGALLAAIDLGSNSFHLIIAKVEHDEMRPVETLSEKVQLGAGLRNGLLDTAAIERGLDCLARFKQILDSVVGGDSAGTGFRNRSGNRWSKPR